MSKKGTAQLPNGKRRRFQLRLEPDLHQALEAIADQEGVSLNLFLQEELRTIAETHGYCGMAGKP